MWPHRERILRRDDPRATLETQSTLLSAFCTPARLLQVLVGTRHGALGGLVRFPAQAPQWTQQANLCTLRTE